MEHKEGLIFLPHTVQAKYMWCKEGTIVYYKNSYYRSLKMFKVDQNQILYVHYTDPGVAAVLPDDVIVVAQVKPLAVLPGVVHHTDPGHEVHHLLPGGVEQVIPALVAPVPVDPVQPEPAARGAPVRHPRSSDGGTPAAGSLRFLLLG